VVTAVQLRGVELKKVPWGQKIDLFRRLFFPVVYRRHRESPAAVGGYGSTGFQGLSPAYLSAAIILDPVGIMA